MGYSQAATEAGLALSISSSRGFQEVELSNTMLSLTLSLQSAALLQALLRQLADAAHAAQAPDAASAGPAAAPPEPRPAAKTPAVDVLGTVTKDAYHAAEPLPAGWDWPLHASVVIDGGGSAARCRRHF